MLVTVSQMVWLLLAVSKVNSSSGFTVMLPVNETGQVLPEVVMV